MTRIIIDIDGDSVKVSTKTIEAEVKIKTEKTDAEPVSEYAKWFDRACYGWDEDAQWNLMFLKNQQRYMSELLRKQNYLFLNDVYRALGMTPTKTGQIIGWIYDVGNPIGDNYVDFGLMKKRNRDFINGRTNTVLLDFNVDGEIISRL